MRISDWSSDVCSSDLPLRRTDHAAERLAAEDVEVEVRHLLVAVAAGIGEDAVAVVFDAEILGDLAGSAEEAGDLRLAGIARAVGEGDVGAFRDDQPVYPGLRLNVVKGQHVLVLFTLFAWRS